MNLEELSLDEKPFETRTNADEYDEALDDGQELDDLSQFRRRWWRRGARADGFGKV